MKRYQTSIVSSVIAGILICGMLAACGEVEKQQGQNLSDSNAAQNTFSDIQPDEPENVIPEVTEPEAAEPEVTEPDTKEADAEIEITVPNVTEPDEIGSSEVLDTDIANTIIETATAQLGVPYASGGSSPEAGFDSSGFVYYCVRAAGIDFPRQISSQLTSGSQIGYSDLAPGDAVYFSAEPNGSASFCGIYVGGGLMIYSPVPDDFVKTANITTGYWTARFVTGIRPAI